jgi:hypothetical protein
MLIDARPPQPIASKSSARYVVNPILESIAQRYAFFKIKLQENKNNRYLCPRKI